MQKPKTRTNVEKRRPQKREQNNRKFNRQPKKVTNKIQNNSSRPKKVATKYFIHPQTYNITYICIRNMYVYKHAMATNIATCCEIQNI